MTKKLAGLEHSLCSLIYLLKTDEWVSTDDDPTSFSSSKNNQQGGFWKVSYACQYELNLQNKK